MGMGALSRHDGGMMPAGWGYGGGMAGGYRRTEGTMEALRKGWMP